MQADATPCDHLAFSFYELRFYPSKIFQASVCWPRIKEQKEQKELSGSKDSRSKGTS